MKRIHCDVISVPPQKMPVMPTSARVVPCDSSRFARASSSFGVANMHLISWFASFDRIVTFNYDAASNRNYVQWPDGHYISYSFDALNRMTEVRENSTTAGVGVLQTFYWDALSRRSSTTPTSRANGTTCETSST